MLFCKKNKRNKGFSLMEVIISVGIVSFAFVGVMSVFASNIRVEIQNRDRVTASYLAQEAVEVIRQKRDTNWFTGGAADWDNGIKYGDNHVLSLIDPGDLSKGWDDLVNAGNADYSYKKRIFLNNNGNYVQCSDNNKCGDGKRPSSWKDTNFRRVIKIEKDPVVPRIKMTVTVYYGDNNRNVQLVSYLYNNWYTN